MITLIDYGAGNLHSLQGALNRLGFQSVRAVTPADAAGIRHPDPARGGPLHRGPGQRWWSTAGGAMLPGLAATAARCWASAWACSCWPKASEESPGASGLGLLPGMSRLLGPGVKVPNMGWAKVRGRAGPPGAAGHSARTGCTSCTATPWTSTPRPSWSPPTAGPSRPCRPGAGCMGFQGHPEKSGAFGESLLGGVLRWMGEAPCA